MSYKVDGTTITLTRGDTFKAYITITNNDGTEYTPVDGDVIRFAMKKTYTADDVLIRKDIPVDTMMLVLESDDTKTLDFGKGYVYDIQITKADGTVYTFITKGVLSITEEVD